MTGFDSLYFYNTQAEHDTYSLNSYQSYKCKLHNKSEVYICASICKFCSRFSLNCLFRRSTRAIEALILNKRVSVSYY